MKQYYLNHEDCELLSTTENEISPKYLSEDVLIELDTALANDAYYSMQSLLKDDTDDYDDDEVELNNETDRKLLVRIRTIHRERCRILNNRKRYRKTYQQRLLRIKHFLDYLGLDLEETKGIYRIYGLDWKLY